MAGTATAGVLGTFGAGVGGAVALGVLGGVFVGTVAWVYRLGRECAGVCRGAAGIVYFAGGGRVDGVFAGVAGRERYFGAARCCPMGGRGAAGAGG